MEGNIIKVPNLNIKPIDVKNCFHCKHCINLFYVAITVHNLDNIERFQYLNDLSEML